MTPFLKGQLRLLFMMKAIITFVREVYYIVLHCITLYYIVLHCITLYYTIIHDHPNCRTGGSNMTPLHGQSCFLILCGNRHGTLLRAGVRVFPIIYEAINKTKLIRLVKSFMCCEVSAQWILHEGNFSCDIFCSVFTFFTVHFICLISLLF